ncbi:MAG: septum formation initiator family protein [Bacteroidaceae bacterium]|nr:septum formation initiator family protein [Bacteroidaceae bacterium]
MSKIKNIFAAVSRHKYAITIVSFLLIICFFDQNNLMLRLKHRRQIYDLDREIEYYEALRDSSVAGLKELAEDSSNLERVAREKYGMHFPNEDVFIIR